ncbi:MAG: energy-coupling factor transporter transmembrane protein EcfT [Mycoplasmataceae bacterium]|nr:energy-coupling factor transporter transmembrane protein EcfT [Mycoplasmataceae bacterium]
MFHKINPVLKFISIIFLIIFVFTCKGIILNVLLVTIVFGLWFMAKPTWKATKIILFSMLFVFVLIFLINWIVVKTPNITVFDNGSVHSWWKLWITGEKQYDYTDGKYSYIISTQWGIKYYNGWESSYFQSGSYKEAYSHFHDLLRWTGYKFTMVEKGDNWWFAVAYQTSWYTLSSQTFLYAAIVTIKITLMVVIVTLLVSTTTNVELSYAIYIIILPLKVFRAPVKEWSMILALAFRFVPSLVEESKRILNAQASRGVDFNNGNYADKMKSMSSLLIPIFSIGFIKSNDLANAMEARSYFPEIVGSKYRQYVFSKIDLLYSIIFGILAGFIILLSIHHTVFGPLGTIDVQLFQNR